MILIALLIGLVLIAAAVRGTEGALFSALGTDLPAYAVWAAAIVAVGALGFIPGLKTPSRALLALVIVVVILTDYQPILTGFASVSQPPSTGTDPGGAVGAGSGGSPPSSTLSAPAAASTSAGANLFGISPGASAFGAQLGQAFGQTLGDTANSFGAYISGAAAGGGP